MKFSEIVAYVESNNNRFAFRFEESLYKRFDFKKTNKRIFKIVKKIHQCSDNSAKVILYCSWGKYQILGINLYDICSLSKTVFEYLFDESLQDLTFQIFMSKVVRLDENKLLVELDELNRVKQQLMLESSSLERFSDEFKRHIIENRDRYDNVISFIQRYNGARFFSLNAYSYLLRMLYFYEKLSQGVK